MTNITLYPDQPLNAIDPGILGHFVEHAAPNIPQGIFQPGHPLADEDGLRTDVLDALRRVGVTQLRWGGNFSSHYHWMDGVGPCEERPKKLNFAWEGVEDNQFGTAEFVGLCRKLGAQPVIGVNMGSGTAEEAMNWVEYCNGTEDSFYANLRRAHGYEEPFNVHYWCLGNEMYGQWQFGYLNAEAYAEKAEHFAFAMRRADPSIHLTAVGLETDPDWNVTVVRRLAREKTDILPGEFVDAMSIHYYPIGSGGAFTGSTNQQRMAMGCFFSERTRSLRSAIEVATDDPESSIKIAWDEWNVMGGSDDHLFTLENVLWSASVLNGFIRDSQYVSMANYTFFVNWNGPVQTEADGLRLEAEYGLFEIYGERLGDQLLRLHAEGLETTEVDMPVDGKGLQNQVMRKNLTRKRTIPYLDVVATRKSKTGEVTVFVVNRHPDKAMPVCICLPESGAGGTEATLDTLWSENLLARNTRENPNAVRPARQAVACGDGGWAFTVKAHSVNALTFRV